MTSPSTLTLGKAKTSSILNIAGVCANDDQFTGQLNEAVESLVDAGEFWNTVVKARVCIRRNCITWPRWVGTVLAANLCNHNRPLANRWYDFLPISRSDCMCSGRWPSSVAFVDDGMTPVFDNVPCGTANYIRVYPRFQADIGKTITFYGIDANGQELMTRDDSTGEWSQGETLVLASPYTQSEKTFREVTRVTKEVTTGPVDVYQYDSTNQVLLDMAHYEASETDPMYRHTTIRGGVLGAGAGCACTNSDGTSVRKVEALIKLQFIPVVVDSDTVQIDCIPALKLAIQGIRLAEAGDYDNATKTKLLAIKALNTQLRNKMPIDQIPIEVSSCGTALPALHGIGLVQ